MKNLFGLTILLASLAYSQGQGSVIFANDSRWLQSPPDRLVRFTNATSLDSGFSDGTPVFTNVNNFGLRAQLYYGASTAPEGSLTAVSTAPATFRSSTSGAAGTWFGSSRTLQEFDSGDTVSLQVRVWDINLASTYADAENLALFGGYQGLLGKSLVFSYTIPSIGPFQPTMDNFQGFYIEFVPEPSAITLLLLGLGLLMFRGVRWPR